MPLVVRKKPSFRKTLAHLAKRRRTKFEKVLHTYGKRGVSSLAAATPKDTSEAANSWRYEVESNGDNYRLVWHNDKMAGRVPLVILLQYGHGTGTGGYVQGRNFINPALDPVFEQLKMALVKEAIR